MELKLEQMVTERRNENTMNLDMMSPLEIVTVMNQEDLLIPAAIKPHLETIAKVVTWGTESVTDGACRPQSPHTGAHDLSHQGIVR